MLGNGVVRPTANELPMRLLARRSVVALCDIPAGESLSESNIGLKRPGNGLSPALYSQIIGLTASRLIGEGELVRLGDLS